MSPRSAAVIASLAIALVTMACARGLTTPTPATPMPVATASSLPQSTPSVATGDPSYPPPVTPASVATPLSYPQPEEQKPAVTRAAVGGTPIAGRGNVQGLLLNRGGGTAPMSDYIVYLAQLLPNTDGTPSGIVRVDENTAPMTITDSSGRFFFGDVEPGYYALAIKHPLNLLLARDVNSGEDVLFEVKAGEVVDIGEIVVSIGG